MGLYGSSAPKPDKRIGKAAELSAKLGVDYLNWTKERAKVTDAWAAKDRARYDSLYKGLEDNFLDFSDRIARGSIEHYQNERLRAAATDKRAAGLDATAGTIWNHSVAAEGRAAAADKQAGAQMARYLRTYAPIEDRLAKEAATYDSAGRQASAAREAVATVRDEAAAAAAQERREMASLGVNPASGRFAATRRASQLRTGLAAVGASNTARQDVRDRGIALRQQAAGIGGEVFNRSGVLAGQGLAQRGLAAQHRTMSLGARGQAEGVRLAANAERAGAEGFRTQALQIRANMANRGSPFISNPLSSFTAGTSTVASGNAGAQQGLSTAIGGYNTMFNQKMAGYEAGQQGTGAMMEGIGTLAGFAMFSDEDAKTEKKPAPGMLGALRKMRVEGWEYKPDAPMGDGGGVEHVGTYAQDFKEATGKGDGKTIPVVDAIGVTMGAIKELDKKVERLGRGMRRDDIVRRGSFTVAA